MTALLILVAFALLAGRVAHAITALDGHRPRAVRAVPIVVDPWFEGRGR